MNREYIIIRTSIIGILVNIFLAAFKAVMGLSLEAYVGAVISAVIIKSGIEMMQDTLNKILGERENAALTRRVRNLITDEPEVKGDDWTKYCQGENVDVFDFLQRMDSMKNGHSSMCPFCGGKVTMIKNEDGCTTFSCNICDMSIQMESK